MSVELVQVCHKLVEQNNGGDTCWINRQLLAIREINKNVLNLQKCFAILTTAKKCVCYTGIWNKQQNVLSYI